MEQSPFINGLLGGGYQPTAPRNLYAGLLSSNDAQPLPAIDVAGRVPGEDEHKFVQQQLHSGEPQLPQRDVQAEYDAYRSVLKHLPYASTFKAFGALPDLNGGVHPGVAQELYNGDYKGALSDLLGVATTAGISRFVLPKILPKGGNGPPQDKNR